MNEKYQPIRSFVRRMGRITPRQKQALEGSIARVELNGAFLNLNDVFDQPKPVVLEIGFGMGDSLLEQAESTPDINFLGIEVYPAGVGKCLAGVTEKDLNNLKVIQDDAVEVLRDHLLPNSLDQVQIFFPDPWHKKRHNKRRLIQPDFVGLIADVLKPGGVLWIATDWAPYAEHIEEVMATQNGFKQVQKDSAIVQRVETKYERRGLRLEHAIADLVYQAA